MENLHTKYRISTSHTTICAFYHRRDVYAIYMRAQSGMGFVSVSPYAYPCVTTMMLVLMMTIGVVNN